MWFELTPWLLTMVILIILSGLFSASEAAYFYLQRHDLKILAHGNATQRTAARLMDQPDYLLSAVLFWNLLVNMIYFSISARVGLQLQQNPETQHLGVLFGVASVLVIILLSEMLPKSFAVLRSRWFASLVSFPLLLAIKLIQPLVPLLRFFHLLTMRLIVPRLTTESDLDISDLSRAVELSTLDAKLDPHEYRMLRNILELSQVRADEWMRPRRQFVTYQAPVTTKSLQEEFPPSGYVLVTQHNSTEILYSIDAQDIIAMDNSASHMGTPVISVPWCATVADVHQRLTNQSSDVAIVVNEFGDMIGIITNDDIADALFVVAPSRTQRLRNETAILDLDEGLWQVNGLATLRRLEKHLQVSFPHTRSATLLGVLHEVLQRMPKQGDRCNWGPLQLEVTAVAKRGDCTVEVSLFSDGGGA